MKLGLVFGSVVFLGVGIMIGGNLLEVGGQVGGLKKYENSTLGISFQHPSNWRQDTSLCAVLGCINFFITLPKLHTATNTSLNPSECVGNESQSSFNDSITASEKCDVYSINVGVFELNKPDELGSEACNCNTLKDFVTWSYNRNYVDSEYSKNTFINDNQTTIGSNYSAWQMENVQSTHYPDGSGSKDKQFIVWAINNKLGYRLEYSGPTDNRFNQHLNEIKNMLKTLVFTAPPTEKKPSFLNSSDMAKSSVPSIASDNSVKLLSSNDFIDSIGTFHVVGEVQNNSPTNAQFVKITGTFYDSSNNVVGTDFTYTNPSDIGAGQKAPFDLTLLSASIPISQIDHYNLVASYR